ncbi:MAG: hypothetical protein M1828_004730 [Chrysothrix sp. TS-e1954]|nr:MAG: hypothetical protein M1828_004730 [Chrysothrix sp. TS-e1954]
MSNKSKKWYQQRDEPRYSLIGRGSRSNIYVQHHIGRDNTALKIAHVDQSDVLWSEHERLREAYQAFDPLTVIKRFRPDQIPRVPQPAGVTKRGEITEPHGDQKAKDSWNELRSALDLKPNDQDVLRSERIWPCLRHGGPGIINTSPLQPELTNIASYPRDYNQGFLVHLCLRPKELSEELSPHETPPRTARRLNLDTLTVPREMIDRYAEKMAYGLAMLHCRASQDGEGVKFVLGRALKRIDWNDDLLDKSLPMPEYATVNPERYENEGSDTLWMINFSRSQPMQKADRVDQAVNAFWRSGPYLPLPNMKGSRERRLWEVFKKHYVVATGAMPCDLRINTGLTAIDWANLFMQRLEAGS